ncbi:Gem-associated protein 5, partial [Globisporangium splendens]
MGDEGERARVNDALSAVQEVADVQLTSQGREHVWVLPASANWYCSKMELTESERESTKSSPINGKSTARFFAHLKRGKKDQRVTAVQFLNDSNGALRLLCGGEEGSVQIWDVASLTLVEQHRKHGVEVMAVTASSQLDPTFVVAGDRQGRISTWKRDDKKVNLFTPIAGDGVFAMSMAPHDKALVAVGYRSGVLCIVDALQGNIRYRLEGHDQEIHNVVWKVPSPSAVSGDAASGNGIWFASSSRDRSIKVWKMESADQPTLEQVLTLPKGKLTSSFNQAKRLWLPIAWSYNSALKANYHRLWSGSFDGNLFQWEWASQDTAASKKKAQACKPTVFKNGHSRLLFNIVSLSPAVGAPESKRKSAPSMMTTSLDREFRVWREASASGSAPTCQNMFLGLGGHVYGVSYNASNEIVAAGVGDQTIRLWNVSPSTAAKNPYQADLLWRGLQSKVTCIAWNPFQKSVLAYGTEDGQIGFFDIESKKNTRFKSSHSSQVQALQWRRKQSKLKHADESDKNSFIQAMLALENAQADGYSLEDALADQDLVVGKQRKENELQVLLWSQEKSGHILESNAEKAEMASKKVNLVCSAFAWGSHPELLAVGRENGVIEIYSCAGTSSSTEIASTFDAEFVLVQKFHEHEQKVTRLAWSAMKPSILAIGSQDGKIIVVNAGGSSEDMHALQKPSRLNQQVVGVFLGHNGAISSLCWGSHEDKMSGSFTTLASGSCDGTVQVWHVESNTRLSCFRHHIGRVLTVDWIDAFVLASGGEDQTIRVWDYREQKEMPISAKAPQSANRNARSKQQPTAEIPNTVDLRDEEQVERKTKPSEPEDQPEVIKKSTKAKKKKKVQTGIFHASTQTNVDESVRHCRHLIASTGRGQQSSVGHLSAFEFEEDEYKKEQDWEHLAQVYLLQGKISEALRVVANEGALNASWVAHAPMAGVDVWREVTNVYAHQLDKEGDKKNAVRDAIKCLASGHAYKEAIALIHSRLGPQDSLLSEVKLQHASYLEKNQRFGEAAQILLSIGSGAASSQAVCALVKTSDTGAFDAALDILISLKSKHTKSAEEYANLADAPAVEDWSIPSSAISDVIGKSLLANDFALAEKASQFIGAGVTPTSPLSQSTPNRLVRSFLGVLSELSRLSLKHLSQKRDCETIGAIAPDNSLWTTSAPDETQEFFLYIMDHKRVSYSDQMLASFEISDLKQRAEHFWGRLFSHCRENGFWFGEIYEADIMEAQELLMDKNCFAYLVTPYTGTGSNETLARIMQVGRCLLQFLFDAICGYLLSGLERIQEIVEVGSPQTEQLPKDCDADSSYRSLVSLQVGLMSLFFPSGIVNPRAPPRIGELAVEIQDTQEFWRSFLFYQCRTIFAAVNSRRSKGNVHTDVVNGELEAILQRELEDENELNDESNNRKLLQDLGRAIRASRNGKENIADGTVAEEALTLNTSDHLEPSENNEAKLMSANEAD